MDALQALSTRRSVRSFTEEDVSEELLEQMLRAAMAAPSAGNAQPWEFVVIREKEKLSRITAINQYAAFAPNAPLGILICGNLTLEKFPGYWIEDTSAAMENLLIAAHALGLGAVWTGIYPMEERVVAFRSLIDAPDYIIPMGFAVIGHPKKLPEAVDRFNVARIHREKW